MECDNCGQDIVGDVIQGRNKSLHFCDEECFEEYGVQGVPDDDEEPLSGEDLEDLDEEPGYADENEWEHAEEVEEENDW